MFSVQSSCFFRFVWLAVLHHIVLCIENRTKWRHGSLEAASENRLGSKSQTSQLGREYMEIISGSGMVPLEEIQI